MHAHEKGPERAPGFAGDEGDQSSSHMERHAFFCQEGRKESSHGLRLGMDEGDLSRGDPSIQPDADLLNGMAKQVEGTFDEPPLEGVCMVLQIQRSLEQGFQSGRPGG